MFIAALFIIAQIGNRASLVAQMVKKPPANVGDVGSTLGLQGSLGNSNPIFLPGKSHGQRSLGGDSPWSSKRVRHDYQLNNNNKLEIKVSNQQVNGYTKCGISIKWNATQQRKEHIIYICSNTAESQNNCAEWKKIEKSCCVVTKSCATLLQLYGL